MIDNTTGLDAVADDMTLHIKDPEALRLARAIADATGETMTHVVTEALRERFSQLHSARERASVQELLAIADEVAKRVKRPYADHADILYDDSGLPK